MKNYSKEKYTIEKRPIKKNSFSHFYSGKGITLMSLIIYITIMFVILVLTMRVMKYYTGNIRDVADTSFEIEYEKFNMYMLQETNKSYNAVVNVSDNDRKITFYNGNTIYFEKEEGNDIGKIYYNDIKICDDVDDCVFTKIDDSKIMVSLTINGKNVERYFTTNKLPEFSYEKLDYIESSRKQFIRTDYIPKTTTRIELEASFSGTFQASGGSIFSCADTDYRFSLNFGDVTSTANKVYPWVELKYASGGTAYPLDVTNVRTRKSLIVMESGNFSYGGLTETIATKSTNNQDVLYICGSKTKTPFKSYDMKIYSCKLYEGDVLIKDFVPACRYPDEKTGLYDLVGNVFYENGGTEEFKKGSHLAWIEKNNNEIQEESIYLLETKKVPKTYQKVEYIEGNGNQYIDTGVLSHDKINTEMKYALSVIPSSSERFALFGTWVNNPYVVRVQLGNQIVFFKQVDGTYAALTTTLDTNIHTVKTVNDNLYYDNQIIPINKTVSSFTGQTTITVLAQHQSIKYAHVGKVKVYSFKIYNEEELIRDYIPCYRRIDGEAGLYDMVEEKFYSNIGKGTFTIGPEVGDN